MHTDWNDDELLKPKGRRHADQVQPREEGDGLTSAKNQVGVVFIDERGGMLSCQYAHLLTIEPVGGDGIEAVFTTHKVTMTGYGLSAPVQNSLLMLLTLHKRAIVKARPGGEERDFGPPEEGWQVVTMRWEKAET